MRRATKDRARRGARDALVAVAVALGLLVVCDGSSVGRHGATMSPGVERDVVVAVGHPAGWIARHLPAQAVTHQVTAWLSPDENLGTRGGSFAGVSAGGTSASRVTPAAFSPSELGERAPRPALRRLLVTGDSMSQPLDAELARALADRGVVTKRDVHIGSGLSKSFLVDWGRLAARQVGEDRPDAVVMFLGANEGFPMKSRGRDVTCCGAAWAAEYATRARAVMATYLRGGAAHVYWLLIPGQRDAGKQRIARTVNAAIRVAAGGFGAQVNVVDTPAIFTPGGRYRSAMRVGDATEIVRNPDGIHLNEAGADILRSGLEEDLARTYAFER